MKKCNLLVCLCVLLTAQAQTTVNGSRTVLGDWDASQARSTKPAKSGTSLPATCSVGEEYFKTDATAGQNKYGCTSPNTWTQMGGSSSAPAAIWMFISGTGVSFPISAAGKIKVVGLYIPQAIQFTKMQIRAGMIDSNTANYYDIGVYDTSRNLLAHTGPVNLNAGGIDVPVSGGGTVTLGPGKYYIAFTGNATSGAVQGGNPVFTFLAPTEITTTSTGGILPASISGVPADYWTASGTVPWVNFHN